MKKFSLILLSAFLSLSMQAQGLYIIGDAVSDWSSAFEMKSVSQEPGIEMYCWVGEMQAGGFKFRSNRDDWNGTRNLGSGSQVTIDGRSQLYNEGGNCSIATPGHYIVFVQLYQYDSWVYVMNAHPETLYILGDDCFYSFGFYGSPMKREADGIFTISSFMSDWSSKINFPLSNASDYPTFGAPGQNVYVTEPFTEYDLKPLVGSWEYINWLYKIPWNENGGAQFHRGYYQVKVDLNNMTWSFQPYLATYPEPGSTVPYENLTSLSRMSITLPGEIEEIYPQNITITDNEGNQYGVKSLGVDKDDPRKLIFQADTWNTMLPTDRTYTVTFYADNKTPYATQYAIGYETDPRWNNNPHFSYSFSVGPAPTGIDKTEAAAAISYKDHRIEAEGFICVYNMQGMLVCRGENVVEMKSAPQGIYIARCGNDVMKIKR